MRSLAFVSVLVALVSTSGCKGPSSEKTITADPAPSCSCSCPSAGATTAAGALPLDLPEAGADSPDPVTVLRVTLDADGNMTVDGTPVADDEALLAHVPKGDLSDLRVTIAASASVTHGKVIHLLDVLKSAGIVKIGFAVSKVPAAAPSSPVASPP
jgi:biopolymer transport protein ExbD